MANSARKRVIFIVVVTAITVLLASVSLFLIADNGDDDGIEFCGTILSPTMACVNIGKYILQRKGSAADAVLAALFCENMVNSESMTLNGPFIATTYQKLKTDLRSEEVDADSVFIMNPTEMQEFYMIQHTYGKLKWKDVIEPALRLGAILQSPLQDEVDTEAPTNLDIRKLRLKLDPISPTKSIDHITYTTASMGSGPILSFILNLTERLMSTDRGLLWHRLIEIFKHASGIQKELGDNLFLQKIKNMNSFTRNTPEDFADSVYPKIRDDKTFNNYAYYGKSYPLSHSYGTASIVAVDCNGQVFSLTNTVNTASRVQLPSPKAKMGKFEKNFLTLYDARISAMVPIIIVDKDENSTLAKISTDRTAVPLALAQVIIRHILLKETINEAVRAPRLYYDWKSMQVQYEAGFNQTILDYLKLKGHILVPASSGTDFSTVTAIIRHRNGLVETIVDPRTLKNIV